MSSEDFYPTKATVMLRRNLYGTIAADLAEVLNAAGRLQDKDLDTRALYRVMEYARNASGNCSRTLSAMMNADAAAKRGVSPITE